MDGIKQARRAFALAAERAAAVTVDQPIVPFAPRSRLSKHAHWFTTADDGVLLAVVSSDEKTAVADEVLAYGLAWQENRDLHLVLPGPMVVTTLTRLPWLETKVRVWVMEGEHLQQVRTLSRMGVLDRLRDLPPRISRKASLPAEADAWIAALDTSGLEAHDRSYRSWHHQGLQVLKVSRTRAGIRVQAGVQYSNPAAGQEPYNRVFAAAPTPEELAQINDEVARAVGHGGSRTSQMREHRLQATMRSQAPDLGLSQLIREFPAYRGLDGSSAQRSGRPGYIDFLGIDSDGHFHVVETKIGHDPRVVLQALDYAIWVCANEADIRARVRAEGTDAPEPKLPDLGQPLRIQLVLGAGANNIAFNPYLAPQLEALDGDVGVQVHLVSDVAATPLHLRRLRPQDMWDRGEGVAKPVVGPRWPQLLTRALLGDDE